jgi:hypothetical protein
MFISQYRIEKTYLRKSKNGKEHEYKRFITICNMRCDSCGQDFERPKGSMDPKRLSNNYFHVCDSCDAKRFAQQQGATKRTRYRLKASSDLPIGRL